MAGDVLAFFWCLLLGIVVFLYGSYGELFGYFGCLAAGIWIFGRLELVVWTFSLLLFWVEPLFSLFVYMVPGLSLGDGFNGKSHFHPLFFFNDVLPWL